MEEKRTITLSLPSGTIEEIDKLALEEQTTRNEICRSALDQYFRSHQAWKQIFEQGEEWARELGIRNEEDVDKLIHEFRKEQASIEGGL